jgi:hypothetical protein
MSGTAPACKGRCRAEQACGRHIQHSCRSCVELGSLLRLSGSEPIRQSAGWPRAASTQPDLQDLEAAKADQGPPLQALPGQKSANRIRQADPAPGRETEPRRRPGTEGTGAGRDRGRPRPRRVRTHREPLVPTGHQRSPPHTGTAGRAAFTTTSSDGKLHGAGFEPRGCVAALPTRLARMRQNAHVSLLRRSLG